MFTLTSVIAATTSTQAKQLAERYSCQITLLGENDRHNSDWFRFTINDENQLLLDESKLWGTTCKEACRKGFQTLNQVITNMGKNHKIILEQISNTRFAIIVPYMRLFEIEMHKAVVWDGLDDFAVEVENTIKEITSQLNCSTSASSQPQNPNSKPLTEEEKSVIVWKALDLDSIDGNPDITIKYEFKTSTEVEISVLSYDTVLETCTIHLQDDNSISQKEKEEFSEVLARAGVQYKTSTPFNLGREFTEFLKTKYMDNNNPFIKMAMAVWEGDKELTVKFRGSEEFTIVYEGKELKLKYKDLAKLK